MRHCFLSFLKVASFLALTGAAAFACTCIGPSNAKTVRDVAAWYGEGAHAGAIIFEGSVEKQELSSGPPGAPATAMSMTFRGEHRVVTIRMLRVYRGEVASNVTVLTGIGGGDCGFDFETGKQYLVYASRIDAKTLSTNICSGTSSLERAGPALRLLRGEAPAPDDLLDPEKYSSKFQSRWYGTLCGRVTQEDGSPFAKASVDLTQVRDDPFLPKTASDPNLSKTDGRFCIPVISPGRYVLTAEHLDYAHDLRLMGYYPGVTSRSEAKIIDIVAGANLRDVNFMVHKQPVYTVRFRVVSADGTPLPLDLRVAIESVEKDGLSYDLVQHVDNGKYTMGYVPPGRYVVRTFAEDGRANTIAAGGSKWSMITQEIEIKADSEIELKLTPAN